MNRKLFVIAVLFSTFLVCGFRAETMAAGLGDKPVKLVVASSVGGGEDVVTRAIAPLLQQRLGVSVTVENQPGAAGRIAFEKLQKAEPDGHTIVVYTFPKSIISEYVGQVAYKTQDFTPIYAWSKSRLLLNIHPDSPWKTFGEFVNAAKANRLAGGVPNPGGTSHLIALTALGDLGIEVTWVPYDSGAQMLAALAGKHLDFGVCLTHAAGPLIDAGRIKPLVLLATERDPYLPGVPIPKEFGLTIPDVPQITCAMSAPKTPGPVAKILEDAFSSATRDPVYVDFMKKRKATIDYMTGEELRKLVKELSPRIEKLAPALKGKK